MDVETGNTIFDWDSRGHVDVLESTHRKGSWEKQCKQDYDITHFNAVDKFEDGDYLLSGRHTVSFRESVSCWSPQDRQVMPWFGTQHAGCRDGNFRDAIARHR